MPNIMTNHAITYTNSFLSNTVSIQKDFNNPTSIKKTCKV